MHQRRFSSHSQEGVFGGRRDSDQDGLLPTTTRFSPTSRNNAGGVQIVLVVLLLLMSGGACRNRLGIRICISAMLYV